LPALDARDGVERRRQLGAVAADVAVVGGVGGVRRSSHAASVLRSNHKVQFESLRFDNLPLCSTCAGCAR
jgi:hypothetical protein